MASKKTINDGLSFGSDLDDLSFDSFGFGDDKQKGLDKRKPITKIAFGAAKGLAKGTVSEATVRNVLSKALPKGYSTSIELAYDARDSASELYHTAADEWRKMEPSARRLVQKIVPHSAKILPKRLQNKLKNFAEGGYVYSSENPDEAMIRRVLGELEGVSASEREQDRAEDQTRESIRTQMEDKRHRTSLRVLASIDARLAQANAFNDQAFARFQKRSLEIQYRSYFVQRDLLKVQMAAAQDTRDALRALVHNTALPDVDKLTTSDRIRQGLRKGARGAFDLGANAFLRNYFGNAKNRLNTHVRGVMSGIGSALSFGNMGAEQLAMAKEMGIDNHSSLSEEAGAGLMNTLMGYLANQASGGFRRSGKTAQVGARLHRTVMNAQSHVSNWASKYDNSLLGQLLLNPLKDILGGNYREDRRVGTTAMAEGGAPGIFTKRTQRSIEEVMPDYLSRILHELQMSRTGKATPRLVYNENQNRMTSERVNRKDLHAQLFETPNAKFGQESVANMAAFLLGDKKISPKAYAALQQEIALSMHDGKHFKPSTFTRKGQFLDAQDAREVAQAMKGRFHGNMQHGQDQTVLMKGDELWRHTQSSLQNPTQYLSAMHDMGHTQALMDQGLLERKGDTFQWNAKNYIKRQYQSPVSQMRSHPRAVSEDLGFGPNWEKQLHDHRVDLYKTPDGQGTPVVSASKVRDGKYTSITTGQAIYYMHDVAGGVMENGRLVVSAQDVLKLFTRNGTPFAQWLQQTPKPETSGGRLGKAQDWLNAKMRGVGERTDRLVDKITGHPTIQAVSTPRGRREAAAGLGAMASDLGRQGKRSLQSAVHEGLEHPQVKAASRKVKRAVLEALAAARRAWRHAVSAARYGQSLYKAGGFEAVIDETKLRAGEYYSAKTGKPITDLRDLADGVKTKAQQWVAHPEEILELQTKGGLSFKTLMGDLQQAVEHAKNTVTQTATDQVKALHESPVGVAVEAAKAALSPTERASQAVNEARAQAEVSGAGNVVGAVSSPESMESLLNALNAFKEGNLEHLNLILEVLSERDFTQVGGTVMGSGPAKGKAGLRERLHGFLRKHTGTVGNALVTGASHATRGAARLYGKYVGGVFRGIGSAARLGSKIIRAPFRGDKTHLGKEPSDVYVDNERQPRLTSGGMRAGAYIWINPKTQKPGGLVRAPKDIQGEVKSATDPTVTLISLDDLEHHIVSDRKGYSFARRTLKFGARVASAFGSTYLKMFTLPFRAINAVGRGLSAINNAFKKPVDVYVKGDTPWEPRLTAMGMRRGIYVVKSHFGRMKKVRTINDIDGDVYDTSKNPPEIRLSAEDFSKGIVDVEGKRLVPKSGLFSRIGAGLIGGAASAVGGLFRVAGGAVKLGAAAAMMPVKFLHNLMTGKGLLNFSLFGGHDGKVGKTSDEKTHDLLTEVLHMLDGRLPETTIYRRGSWEERMAARKKAKADKSAKGILQKGKDGASSLWSKLKGMFHRKKKDEDGKDSSLFDKLKDLKNLKNTWKDIKGAKGMGGKVKALLRLGRGAGGLAGDAGAIGGSALGGGEAIAGVAGAAEGAAGIAGAAEAAGVGAAAVGEAVGGGALLAAAAPVLLVAGAVAAVGAIGYGLYKFGSKVHDLKKREPFRAYRLAQYGFAIKDAIWKASDILKLEQMLLPYVHLTATGATIDKAGLKKNEKAIFKLFDLEKSWYNPLGWFHKTNVKDVTNKQHFLEWMVKRFRPIFLHWISSLQQVTKSVGLADIDDKLKGKEKFDLLKRVKDFPKDALAVTSSPFADYPVRTGRDEQSLLDSCYSDCLKDCKVDDKTKDKGKATVKAAVAGAAGVAGAAAVAAKAGKTGKGGKDVAAKGDDSSKLQAAMKVGAGAAGSRVGLNATANYQSNYAFLGGKLSALEAIRYKTYGLKDFQPDRVKAMFMLETALLDKLDYDGSGKASYSGDASFWFDHYGTYFGASGSDEKAKMRWYSWFAKRFLPTVLQFATAVKKANKNTDPRDADDYLSPVQLLGVANLVITSTYSQGKDTSISVWTFTDSPFDDQPLNTDSKSVDPHLQVLKNDAAKVKMPAATGKAPTPQTAPSAKPGLTPTSQPTQAQQQQQIKKTIAAQAKLPPGMSAGSKAAQAYIASGGKATPVGKPVKQPGNGTGGDINKIPVPKGTGYTALRGTLDAAAKMVGVDPTVLSTFAGIESNYRPEAHAGTSSAAGLGQFLTATWHEMMAKYAKVFGIDPSTPPTDARAASLMLGEYIKENQSYLKRVLGRDPTDTELYMAHFLGPGGAKELIQMPDNAIAAAAMPGPARANQPIFYTKGGSAATKAQVVANLDRRVSRWRKIVTEDGPATKAELAVTGTPGSPSSTSSGIAPPNVGAGKKASVVASALTGGSTTPGPQDAVTTAQSVAKAKATQADRQAQATAMASTSHNDVMSKHAATQTDLQRQMVTALNTIASHTSRTADGLSTLAKTAAVPPSSGPNGTPPAGSAQASASTTLPTPSGMPPMPVSMSRTSYSDANA